MGLGTIFGLAALATHVRRWVVPVLVVAMVAIVIFARVPFGPRDGN